ncbi:serine-rich adhesin for platelets [Drosophila innubila]|uniref:serine-rich adhesin for platelets n=1 Tax=Drosophila innubila TaxID=198719 RepID=UPI00148CDD7F|nr:serine-rich adhesin for platelets [Drosophila innubila]
MKPFDKYQDIEQGGYAKFTGLKTYNKQLKTMIAIGGWNEGSLRFSPLVASAERRQQFIKNILKFLRQNHFDGLDLDWEYPAHREGGKSRDRDNYAQFVQDLRAEFEREAEKTGRTRLLLTMAVPAGIEYIDKGYDVPKLNKYLDWFNVLTYDFHSSHEPSVNHHAPLYSMEDDSEYNYDAELNIDYSIKYYLKAGADRDKLVLGIPTYGRSYTLINEESTELGAPSEGPGEQGDATREKGYLAYYEICQSLKEDSEWTVVQPNADVMGPYAYRRNLWVGYDDEAIVRKKAEYVVAHGLGGIMFWAIDNDDFRGTCSGKPYPLIEAAKEAMIEAFGLGINEVAKPSSPQKPTRSRSRDNGSKKNQIASKLEVSTRRSATTRRPASTTTIATPSTTIRLTEAKGSSLYIGGYVSTTPAPPTTPDPGSDFKCEEEGFFQHPRDCKKYYWCLDSGPSGLGIVAHQFTCPSGLYFNPAADSCDFARNVPCKTKKSTTSAPMTARPTSSSNRVTAAPVARPAYPRITSTTSTTTTTTTTTSAPVTVEEVIEYDEDNNDDQSPIKFSDAEEDPQVIKELIDLIRKVGGVEQLEKHLLQNKDGSITLKENASSGTPTTPSTISKSLYDRVLNRPLTLNSFTRNRPNVANLRTTESTEATNVAVVGDNNSQNNFSKYSSVLRGNSRQGPQNEGIEKISEFDGFLKERKQYVTINRNRGSTLGEQATEVDSENETDEGVEPESNLKQVDTTKRPENAATQSYTSPRRSRPNTTTPPSIEYEEKVAQPVAIKKQTQTKQYATLSRTRGRTTERSEISSSEEAGVSVSSTTNRYKYFERTRPTTRRGSTNVSVDGIDDDNIDEDEEDYEDDSQLKNNRYQLNRTRSSTTTSITTTASTHTTAATPIRHFLRSRAPVTKLSIVDEKSTTDSEESDEDEDEYEDNDDTKMTDDKTTTPPAEITTAKPTLKRIRVIKYRRPLHTIDGNTTNSVTTTDTDKNNNNQTKLTATSTAIKPTNRTSDTKKLLRKIVRKLRPVDTTTTESNQAFNNDDQQAITNDTTSTTRKPFQPSRARFETTTRNEQDNDLEAVNVQRRPIDLQSLRNRLKDQQAHDDPVDGVINDRLKNLLVEKGTSSTTARATVSDFVNEPPSTSATIPASSPRPFFRRKLVAKRPYSPLTAISPTKSALVLSSTRPTVKFVRRKNGRFDPFNSNVRNKGEGFVRSDPREPRLQNTNRFKQQRQHKDEDYYDDEYEEQQEHPQAQLNAQKVSIQNTVRSHFVPKNKLPQQIQEQENSEEVDDYEEDEDEDDNDKQDENEEDNRAKQLTQAPESSQEGQFDNSTPQPKLNVPPAYRSKENRVLPGSRPNFVPTASGATASSSNVPFNQRNRQANAYISGSNRPRVVNRPLGVATSTLTLRPVSNNYERTTPLTPLKPAPFISNNTRSYERKYTGPSTGAPETVSENSLIEDLNIDALNARNKKIFDTHSKKHTTLKPKVAIKAETELETDTVDVLLRQSEGYVTTTPSTPTTNPTVTQSTDTINTVTEIETATAQPQIVFNANANEATKISSLPQDRTLATVSSTTSPPPPATTLLHVFTLLDGVTDEDQGTTGRPMGSKITAMEPKHKLIEINRIVEINSKQAKAAQRKSKANQDFGTLRVESLPHVEQLGEISVVKYVHLVDGSHIQINDGHSTVADYTPTEPIISKGSAPVRNSLPETVGDTNVERDGKSLLPEVIRGAFETSTISLEGLFDSSRTVKIENNYINTNIQETQTTTTLNSNSSSVTALTSTSTSTPTISATIPAANVSRRPVLSVRRRKINAPTTVSDPTTQTTTEFTSTTLKYNRLRSKSTTAAATKSIMTTAATATSRNSNNQIYHNKLKSKSSSPSVETVTLTPATLSTATSNSNLSNIPVNNTHAHHKFQAASYALRRQFQTRRLTTTESISSSDEHYTDVPSTQNPLFKRRLTLISTAPQPRSKTTTSFSETTTTYFGIEDDGDQVAKSSMHSSHFNQIPEQVRPQVSYETLVSSSIATTKSTPPPFMVKTTRRQLIPRPRRPQSGTPIHDATTASVTSAFSPPASRRQQSRRRPHKYIEVYKRPPSQSELATASRRLSSVAHDHHNKDETSVTPQLHGLNGRPYLKHQSQSQARSKSQTQPAVIVHDQGVIECLELGNFPHPLSYRKFISCAKLVETGGIVGWEYTCPKEHEYDSVSGICTRTASIAAKVFRD